MWIQALLALSQGLLTMKGMTYTDDRYCPNVTFDSEASRLNLHYLNSTGTNFLAVVVT
jgi:hypothetical protein